ncbi:hypothetical protein Taro_027449 [Colocasia esculenta]|uniref:WAT1-related protein n=1 Tax=Colocasia esculenta TaxID=4460 RepID=A0A843VRL1_COLES|nr:hypothetical protein [Colocasia esculenta]
MIEEAERVATVAGGGGGGGGALGGVMRRHGPVVGQVYVHVANAALYLLTRVLLIEGMSHYVFVAYRQIVATVAIAPFAYLLERNQKSKLTLKNMGHLFLLSLFGITISQNFTFAGLSLTNTTLSSTMHNLNPAITFVMAVCLRLEKVDVWNRRGQAKIIGTLLCVGGAMVVTLVKGPAINILKVQKQPLTALHPYLSPSSLGGTSGSWILGSLLLAIGSWSWCAFVWIVEGAPSELTGAAWICGIGAVQSLVVALFVEPSSAWRLKWDLQLLNIGYSGILCTAFGLFVQMWCMKERGPIFSTVFSPLTTVLTAILEPMLLHVQLYWGSLLGMVMVILGLYSVLWGKAMEVKACTACCSKQQGQKASLGDRASDNIKRPLLAETQEEGDSKDIIV